MAPCPDLCVHDPEPHCKCIHRKCHSYASPYRSNSRHQCHIEPVYYKMEESHFLSMSNEKSGWFVGISEHVGHALTFMILTDDTQKMIHRSVVHTATDPDTRNLRVDRPPDHEPEEHIQSHIDD